MLRPESIWTSKAIGNTHFCILYESVSSSSTVEEVEGDCSLDESRQELEADYKSARQQSSRHKEVTSFRTICAWPVGGMHNGQKVRFFVSYA